VRDPRWRPPGWTAVPLQTRISHSLRRLGLPPYRGAAAREARHETLSPSQGPDRDIKGAALGWVAGGLLFLVLATANAGGYRYGTSDQAFYIPAIVRALNPAAFPRDRSLIDAEGRLMVFDDIMAGIVRATGLPLEGVFVTGYVAAVALVWGALLLIGSRLYRTPWATMALAAVVTLRHRIPRTSANSFEPYFHPRLLAFAIGLLAVAAILHQRSWAAVVLAITAALVHPTTGLWFIILIGVATMVLDRRARPLLVAASIPAAVFGIWALVSGPLAPAGARMDSLWLTAVQSKDSLFPSQWPAWAWAANLALPVLLWWVHRIRLARGDSRPEDRALMWGALALVALFLVTLPAVTMRWALATQLQVSRIFWLLDFLTALYGIALLSERLTHMRRAALVRVLGATLLAVSAGRAAFVMFAEFPERALFEVHLRQTPWQDAMNWLKRQPMDAHVWADPGHAWKYGSSVRVAAERDVLLEETKDSAVAIYSRDVAVRVLDRQRVAAVFGTGILALGGELLVIEAAHRVAERYDLDYLVTEAQLPLPRAYSNSQFHIYAIGARDIRDSGLGTRDSDHQDAEVRRRQGRD
jgi:hypothetical protein